MDSNPVGSQANFFGVKVSKPGVNVNNASDNDLLYKNDYNTTTYYTAAGTLEFGTLTDGTLGLSSADSSGFVLFEMNGSTWYWYDKNTGKNVMQVGLLPDGTYGWAVATPGNNVSDAYS